MLSRSLTPAFPPPALNCPVKFRQAPLQLILDFLQLTPMFFRFSSASSACSIKLRISSSKASARCSRLSPAFHLSQLLGFLSSPL